LNKTVAFFNGFYVPHLGGVERYTYNVAQKLLAKGYRVIVVTTKHDESLADEEIIEGVKIYRLPVKNFWKNRYPFFKKNELYHELIKRIQNEPIDYYIANTRFHLPALLGVSMAKEKEKKAIVIEHGSSYLTLGNVLADKFLAKIEHWLINKVKKNTDLFYGVSKEAATWLKEFDIIAKGVLYNSVSIEDYHRQTIRKSDDKITISYAGRLQPKMKGIEMLVSSFLTLSKEYENLELVLAGDGPLLESLKKAYSQENIKFLGFVDYEKVLRLDASSDIFVLMSRSEGFSTAMLEAGMLENVIITTPTVGGAKDIMPDKSFGFIIENDEEKLLQTLKELITNKQKMRNLQKKVSKNILENFTWDQSVESFICVFKELDEKQ
jgi:glycosyltransferase involved in cell wall biosynthesis